MLQLSTQRTYLYLLYSEIIYDPIYKEYYNILTLSKTPEGELKKYTKLIAVTKPSSRDLITTQCSIVINNTLLNTHNLNNKYYSNLLTPDELNEFTEFLINNNYVITDYSYSNNDLKKVIYSFKITI
jgi:hypothetical protein